ncbi:rod shape-determining protein RodA [candidate division KSB1 bacterium]|nr:rod shape-determining protein RodA [candidate division KSB1 bacterium]
MLREINKVQVDWVILGCILLFSLYSLMAVYSATYSADLPQVQQNFNKQVVWIILGLVVFFVLSYIPLNVIFTLTYFAYGIMIFLILILDIFGPAGGGARRWFELGGLKFQPSEFMKPILVLALARYLTPEQHTPNKIRHLAVAFMLVLLPFVLVLKQPDLGTSLVYMAALIPVLYWRNLSAFIIFVICSPAISFIASFNYYTFFAVIAIITVVLHLAKRGKLVGWTIFTVNIMVGLLAPVVWNRLHAYQQQRIFTFLGLVSDPQGVGYQIIQSIVAIGSGGFWGKGLLQGTQTQLRFLPAQHTDFIFSVLAEEWGFFGSMLILATFLIFLTRGIRIASYVDYRFASLTVIGLVTIIAFQCIINLGMTMGVMPVTGVPLPFISYGGSAMLTNMFMAGVISRAAKERYL